MKRCVTVMAVGALLFSSAPSVGAADGNTLLRNCGMAIDHFDGVPSTAIPGVERAGYVLSCLSLLSGFRDGYAFGVPAGQRGLICIPTPVPTSQLARVMVRYLRDNPTRLHDRDTALVLFALADSFPCPPGP